MKNVFDVKEFGSKVLLHRKRLRIGLREASKKSGVSFSTLSRVENGNMPDVETFFRLCKWMILPADYFMN